MQKNKPIDFGLTVEGGKLSRKMRIDGWGKKKKTTSDADCLFLFGGPDETRTRDPMRDRHVF